MLFKFPSDSFAKKGRILFIAETLFSFQRSLYFRMLLRIAVKTPRMICSALNKTQKQISPITTSIKTDSLKKIAES